MTDATQPSLLAWSGAGQDHRTTDVAQVLVDAGLAHLDHTFDYAVPESMSQDARPGMRVKVRFAGVERDGYVVDRRLGSDHAGKLSPIRRVVGQAAVLTPEVLSAARSIAARYAGTTMDVLRLAVPPRHAGAEKAVLERAETETTPPHAAAPTEQDLQEWSSYPGGPAFLRRISAGEHPRAVWCALPHPPGAAAGPGAGAAHPPPAATAHWAEAIAAAVAATRSAGRSAVVCLPDLRDVHELEGVMQARGMAPAVLTAEQGRSARYRRFLLALTGRARIVIGTRSAALAPVKDLGLVVCWDDGDDLHDEPRAPYPHVREMLTIRAQEQQAAALIGGFIRTPRAQLLVQDGWARSLTAPRQTVRAAAPRIHAPSPLDLERDGAAGRDRIPTRAIGLLRRGLENGPVLVQVPRAGYIPVVACQQCRTPARCTHCHGPMAMDRPDSRPRCSWCDREQTAWRCPECQGTTMRAVRVGSARTAEELGRAFPGVRVRTSSADAGVLSEVEASPQLVIATPGAEPVAPTGYAAGVLLDAGVLTARPELSAALEALRRWMRAAALVRPRHEVLAVGHGAPAPLQALVRWDPTGFAERELAERSELGFPPVTAMAAVSGNLSAVRLAIHRLDLPDPEILGPVPLEAPAAEEAQARVLVRVPGAQMVQLTRALCHLQALRSAHKEPGSLRIQVDPDQLA